VDLIYEAVRSSFDASYDGGLPILVLRDLPIELRGCRDMGGIARVDVEVTDEHLNHKEVMALLCKVFEPLLAARLIDVIQFNLSIFQRLFGGQAFLDGWQPYVQVIAGRACYGDQIELDRNVPIQSAERVKWSYRKARLRARKSGHN